MSQILSKKAMMAEQYEWDRKIQIYVTEHIQEAKQLLLELAVIPAPSGCEKQRADFCRRWLEQHGAEGVYEDPAGNVIYPYGVRDEGQISLYMAHLDVVFPDEEPLPITRKDHLLVGPGVGDDTANLVNLLMAAAFFAEEKPEVEQGILFAADTGEEGLGNLKGCRQLMKDYGERLEQVISFDLYLGQCFTTCVGSLRYRITARTQGGHSFSAFGNASAIQQISSLVCRLYEKQVPTKAKTTYNVGVIQGGTSVNTIAQEASILYEIRSTEEECLEEMHQFFQNTIQQCSDEGMDLEVVQVGERPCAGKMKPEAQSRQEQLLKNTLEIIRQVTGTEASQEAASTDANMPLSMGIPALTLGTIEGGKAHTREEWMNPDSLEQGMELVLRLLAAKCLFERRFTHDDIHKSFAG